MFCIQTVSYTHLQEKIGLYINLEAQADYYPGYPLEMRGIYYGARRLTSDVYKRQGL